MKTELLYLNKVTFNLSQSQDISEEKSIFQKNFQLDSLRYLSLIKFQENKIDEKDESFWKNPKPIYKQLQVTYIPKRKF